MKKYILSLLIFVSFGLYAQVPKGDPREVFNQNPEAIFPGVHAVYPVTEGNVPALTPAPEGYEPYYIFYYGRHGSRFDMGRGAGITVSETLQKAAAKGKLTAEGQAVLQHVQEIIAFCDGRQGTLSRLGQRELEAIATRMYSSYEGLLSQPGLMTAESSDVPRCVVTMASFVAQMRSLNPALRIEMDSSPYCQKFVKPGFVDTAPRPNMDEITSKFTAQHPYTTDSVLKALFKKGYKVNNANDLVGALTRIAAFGKASGYEADDLIALVGQDNMFNYWTIDNFNMYYHMGQNPLYQHVVIGQMHNSIERMLKIAENPGDLTATLWFSHDSFVYPFVTLLGINDFDTKDSGESTVSEVFQGNVNIPLASNFQLILYRNAEGHRICKLLYNEREATIPAQTAAPQAQPAAQAHPAAPYYDFEAFKSYVQTRLDQYPMYKPTTK